MSGSTAPAGLYELHCHGYGSVPAAMAAQRLASHGLDLADFTVRHHEAYDAVPDIRAALEALRQQQPGADEAFRAIYQLAADGGHRFERFQAKYNILTAASAFRRQERQGPLARAVVDELRWLIDGLVAGWRSQGLVHVELRFMVPAQLSEGQARQCLLILLERCRAHSDRLFQLDLIVSVPRRRPARHWSAIRQVLLDHGDGEHLVGIDFCHREVPGQGDRQAAFCQELRQFNQLHPERALAILIHVGEQIDVGALECHLRHVWQARERGAHRLGHCLVAGIDPTVFAGQTRQATRASLINQRAWEEANGFAPSIEDAQLADLPDDALIPLVYDDRRLAACNAMRLAVLARLRDDAAVVESCPTSNRLLLALPASCPLPAATLRGAGVAVAIGSDDAGIFGTDLPSEWQVLIAAGVCDQAGAQAWQRQHAAWTARRLSGRPDRDREA